MAEPEVVIADPSADTTPAADVEMGGAEEGTDNGASADNGEAEDVEPSGLEDIEPEFPERITFLE